MIAQFTRKKGITRCPAVYGVPTHAAVFQGPIAPALRDRAALREAARVGRAKAFQLFAL